MSNALKSLLFIILTAGFFLFIAACNGDEDSGAAPPSTSGSSTESSQLPPSPIPNVGELSDGRQLLSEKGCTTCHGSDLEGSIIAPALPGHTVNLVLRQVRGPVGAMPIFPPSTISDSELREIADYLAGLETNHSHPVPIDSNEASAQHHWMALIALEDGSIEDALHHIEHTIAIVSGPHQSQMRDIKAEIESGNVHDASHKIKDMIAGVVIDQLNPAEITVELARSAALVGDATNAIHNLDDLLSESGDSPGVAELVANAKQSINAGSYGEAVRTLDRFLDD